MREPNDRSSRAIFRALGKDDSPPATARPRVKPFNEAHRSAFSVRSRIRRRTPGETKALTSDYPIVVQYDRGNGSEVAIKSMHFSGNVQVGMNAADNKWNLFPTTDNQREATALRLFR